MWSRGGGAAAGVKGGAAVAAGVNGRAAVSAGDGMLCCVVMDVGIEEPHISSLDGT